VCGEEERYATTNYPHEEHEVVHARRVTTSTICDNEQFKFETEALGGPTVSEKGYEVIDQKMGAR
jgi:hypothetical protein